jgi:hypothetical protein
MTMATLVVSVYRERAEAPGPEWQPTLREVLAVYADVLLYWLLRWHV